MKFLELFPTTVLGGILDKITPNQLDSYKTHLSLIPYKDVGNNDGKISGKDFAMMKRKKAMGGGMMKKRMKRGGKVGK